MLNFAADPKLLEPLLPVGTELDYHEGQTFVSVVGFLFLNTRVLGFPIPLHRNFEEVNLRFYVLRRTADGIRRGVSFVRELVPRRAIALIARTFYGEPYLALPMRHSFAQTRLGISVEYQWCREQDWETLAMTGSGDPQPAATDSHEEFITEHYWGYTAAQPRLSEYRVDHPRWRLWTAATWKFDADVAALYGSDFVATLSGEPASAFIADGSPVEVHPKTRDAD